MADVPVPRVKLPDFANRKPVQPGPNSWRQDQQKKAAESLGVNHPTDVKRFTVDPSQVRDELNPTAPTFTPLLALPKPRAYIHPATPLYLPRQIPRHNSTRAVTEPMPPMSLFPNKKVLAGLRKKLTHQEEAIDEESKHEEPPPLTTMPNTSSKAARVLGYHPANTDGKNPQTSAPLTTSTPEPFGASGSGSGPLILSKRQQSTPIPEQASRRWLIENGYSTSPSAPPVPTSPALSQQTNASALGGEHDQPKIDAMITGDGKLSPTKQGSYGRVANVEIVEGPGRVPSVRGVIENAEQDRQGGGSSEQRNASGSSQYSQPPGSVRETGQYSQPLHSAANTASPNQHSRLLNSARAQFSRPSETLMTLPSTVYSPDNYAGIWQNDPHVGHTLPPFSPPPTRSLQHPEMQIRDQSINSMTSIPIMFRGSPDEINRPYPGSHASATTDGTWVSDLPNSRNNSFAAPSSSRLSAAMPQPLFTGNHNFVPPPSQHPDFQPSTGPPPPALAQFEVNMHHHMDSVFARLNRTVNDKHDRGMDEISKRFDAMEERLDRGLKHHVAEKLVNVRKDIKTLTQSVDGVAKTTIEAKDLVEGLEDRLKELEKSVEEHGCKCEHDGPSGHASEHNFVGYERGAGAFGGGSENRGAENMQHPYGQQQHQVRQQQQQHGNHTTRSQASTGGRQSVNSSGRQSGTSSGRRSNTVSGPAHDGGRPSGERSGRRAYFAEMGRAIGPEPDVRAHPAFAGQGIPSQDQVWPQAYGQSAPAPGPGSEIIFHVPSFSGGGWYDEVHGRGSGR